MTYLLDVNVWIALAAERHTHHRVARHWFSNLQDEKLAFCRLTQLGFLRLLTNKHVMQEEVMKPDVRCEDPSEGGCELPRTLRKLLTLHCLDAHCLDTYNVTKGLSQRSQGYFSDRTIRQLDYLRRVADR
jgi:predicted nucleic acid-binding protein